MVQNSSFFLAPSSFMVEKERMVSLFCTSQERQNILELKHKLICTNFELESAKTEAIEEMMRSEENIKQLLQLLKIAYLERDEARGQLQSLLSNGLPLPDSPPVENLPTISHAQPVILPPEIVKANSCFKKSDDLSGAYSCHSYSPSPLDCLLDAILPDRDLRNTELADSSTLGASKQDFSYGGSMPVGIVEEGTIDRASMVIEKLVKRKPLPQKGGFLKAVIEAGPLLQTLLLAGPLPRWQNPPPMENWQIPAIPINEGASCLVDQKSTVSLKSALNTSYLEISHGYFQNSSSPMSSFGSFLNRGFPSSDGTDNDGMKYHIPSMKRRRL